MDEKINESPFKKLQVPFVRVLKGFFNLKNKIMENPEKLIGKKVRGFKFEENEAISYIDSMNSYVGKAGVIENYFLDEDSFGIKFKDGESYCYPADQIEAHLVEDEIPTFTKEDLRTAYKIGFDIGIFNKKISSDKSFDEWFDKKNKEEQLTAILGSSDKVSEIMELFKNE